MSQKACVAEQFSDIKHGKQVLPWKNGQVEVRYVKTKHNFMMGSVTDIGNMQLGEGSKDAKGVISKCLKKMKMKYGGSLRDAVSEVCDA